MQACSILTITTYESARETLALFALSSYESFFFAFLGSNQFRRAGVRFVCWFYVVNPQRLTVSGFMEKTGIEPATPGLQDIGLPPTPRRLLRAMNPYSSQRIAFSQSDLI